MLKVVDPTKLKTMSRDTLQDFLDAACVMFDFSGCRASTVSERRALARLQERAQNADQAFLLIAMLARLGIEDGPKTPTQLRTMHDVKATD